MNKINVLVCGGLLGLSASVMGCNSSGTPDAPVASAPVATAPSPMTTMADAANATPTPVADQAALPVVLVHKTPTCGCCGAWVEHMQLAGFEVRVDEQNDLEPIGSRLGVPYGKGSCHTAEVGGYVVEGHVPAEDVKRLLAQKPAAKGLTVPGMPMGSPGMEVPDGRVQPYTVELIAMDGTTTAYANHGP